MVLLAAVGPSCSLLSVSACISSPCAESVGFSLRNRDRCPSAPWAAARAAGLYTLKVELFVRTKRLWVLFWFFTLKVVFILCF